MNLQQIARAAVCAALVALCIAGAELFSTRPAAGQETRPATLHGTAALDQLKRDGQYESLQAAMNQARFSVSHTTQTPLGRTAWHAPNPSAGYDAYITEAGVSIAVNDDSLVSLHLHSLGYGSALRAVVPGKVSGDNQTINITRDGGLQEWFVNGPDGLEHGFTLSQPPGRRHAGVPLRLALQVSAGWRAVANDDGRLVTLIGANGQAVEYGKLVVRDTLGRNIASRLMAVEKQVVIEVNDDEAAYPLTIDPVFALQQKLTAADGENDDQFGFAVALSGNTAAIGAWRDTVTSAVQGSVYVFVRNGAVWTQQAKLTAIDAAQGDVLGWSVAISGDTLVAGAIGDDGERGAAYVFTRSGTAWSFQQKLTANDGVARDRFGNALALTGDTVAIGAIFDDGIRGSVYVFTRNGTTWTQQQKLVANDGAAEDYFGHAITIDGDTLIAGAPYDDITAVDQGSVYVFTRSGTTWTQQPKITAGLASVNEHFGQAVSLGGDTVAVGASGAASGLNANVGTTYVFRFNGAAWAQQAKLFAADSAANDLFGNKVSLSGDTLAIGSRGKGAAYVFARTGTTWTQQAKLFDSAGRPDDVFAADLALSGGTVLVGAYRGDGAVLDQGAAHVFALHDIQHVEQQKLIASDGARDDNFGIDVALDGDTVVVGAYRDTIGTNTDQGSVYVFTRQGGVWTFQQKLVANDGTFGDYFGISVALSGNLLVAGASGDDNGTNSSQGSAYVFTRSGATWTQQPKLTASDGAAVSLFGESVALDGDTLVISAPGDTINQAFQGSVYVYTRSGTFLFFQQKLFLNDGRNGDYFGDEVALQGDTLAVASSGRTSRQGAAYIFTRDRATNNWTQGPTLTANDGVAGDTFGIGLALDDGVLAVGAFRARVGVNTNQGAVYVFTRAGANWVQAPKIVASDGAMDDRFGYAVALDNNLLAIGSRSNFLGAGTQPGAVNLYARVGGTWQFLRKLAASDGASKDYFGSSVAISGNTIAIGAPGDDSGTTLEQGSAYIFVSPTCPAITLAPDGFPSGVIGTSYNQAVTAGGSEGPYQFSLSAGALPPGLTLAQNGLIFGTPTTAGTYRFTLTATALSSLCSGSRNYTLAITPPCPVLTINPANATLATGQAGVPYSQTFTQTGGAGAATFGIAAGALPNGLLLSTGGVLSGTPTAFGDFTFTVTATDTNGCTGARAYALRISAPCPVVTVNPANLPGGLAGTAYDQTTTATGGSAPYTYKISAGALPTGLSLAPAGALTGTPAGEGVFNFTVEATDANGCTGARAYAVTITQVPANSGLQFYPLAAPIRLLDTRAGQQGCDAPAARIAGGTSRTQTAAGRTCDALTIPANAQALTGNITTVESGGGYLTLYPSDAQQPLAANSNYGANEILNNVFTVGLGADGGFKIFVTSDTDVVVDVTGYYAPPGTGGLYFHPLPKPIRLLETRAGFSGAFTPAAPLPANTERPQQARVAYDGVTIPSSALAIAGNATTINNGAGFLTMYPGGVPRPLAASSNFGAGQAMNAPFTVGLSASGEFNIFTTANTDLIVDVLGYYSAEAIDASGAGLLFTPLPSPLRLLETRAGFTGCFTPNTALAGGSMRQQQVSGACNDQTFAAGALAIVGNTTVINSQAGYLTFWPDGASQPLVASSNFGPGQILNRHFTAGLGATGAFNIFTSAQTDLIVDMSGYFAP